MKTPPVPLSALALALASQQTQHSQDGETRSLFELTSRHQRIEFEMQRLGQMLAQVCQEMPMACGARNTHTHTSMTSMAVACVSRHAARTRAKYWTNLYSILAVEYTATARLSGAMSIVRAQLRLRLHGLPGVHAGMATMPSQRR